MTGLPPSRRLFLAGLFGVAVYPASAAQSAPVPPGPAAPLTDDQKADLLEKIIFDGGDYFILAHQLSGVTPEAFAASIPGGDDTLKQDFARDIISFVQSVKRVAEKGAAASSPQELENMRRQLDALNAKNHALYEQGAGPSSLDTKPAEDNPAFREFVDTIIYSSDNLKFIVNASNTYAALAEANPNARGVVRQIQRKLQMAEDLLMAQQPIVHEALKLGVENGTALAALKSNKDRFDAWITSAKDTAHDFLNPSPSKASPELNRPGLPDWAPHPPFQSVSLKQNLDQAGLGRGQAGQQRGAQMIFMPRVL